MNMIPPMKFKDKVSWIILCSIFWLFKIEQCNLGQASSIHTVQITSTRNPVGANEIYTVNTTTSGTNGPAALASEALDAETNSNNPIDQPIMSSSRLTDVIKPKTHNWTQLHEETSDEHID